MADVSNNDVGALNAPDGAGGPEDTEPVGDVIAGDLAQRMHRIPMGDNIAPEEEAPMAQVMYKGNAVDARTAAVLTHVVDECANRPSCTMHLENISDPGDDSRYKAEHDGPGIKFNWKIHFRYNIDTVNHHPNITLEMYPAHANTERSQRIMVLAG